jgi:magnesium-transporting ATPase (P-type)
MYRCVKVWVITGDKDVTALNIGVSCGLVCNADAVLKAGGGEGLLLCSCIAAAFIFDLGNLSRTLFSLKILAKRMRNNTSPGMRQPL